MQGVGRQAALHRHLGMLLPLLPMLRRVQEALDFAVEVQDLGFGPSSPGGGQEIGHHGGGPLPGLLDLGAPGGARDCPAADP